MGSQSFEEGKQPDFIEIRFFFLISATRFFFLSKKGKLKSETVSKKLISMCVPSGGNQFSTPLWQKSPEQPLLLPAEKGEETNALLPAAGGDLHAYMAMSSVSTSDLCKVPTQDDLFKPNPTKYLCF